MAGLYRVPVNTLEALVLGYLAARATGRLRGRTFWVFLRSRWLEIAGLFVLAVVVWPLDFLMFGIPTVVLDVGILLLISRLLLGDESLGAAAREVSHSLFRRPISLTLLVWLPGWAIGLAIGLSFNLHALAGNEGGLGLLAVAGLEIPAHALPLLTALGVAALGPDDPLPRPAPDHGATCDGASARHGLALRLAASTAWAACLLLVIAVVASVLFAARSYSALALLLEVMTPIVLWVFLFGLGRAGLILLSLGSIAMQVWVSGAPSMLAVVTAVVVVIAAACELHYQRLTSRPPPEAAGLLLAEEHPALPSRWKVINNARTLLLLLLALLVALGLTWAWLSRLSVPGGHDVIFHMVYPGALLVLFLLRLAKRAAIRSAEELRKDDPRAPLILLRPFALSRRTVEPMLARIAWPCGPLITLVPPDAKAEEGAAPVHAADSVSWHAHVEDQVADAKLVLFCIGPGDGLRWELEHVLTGDLKKLVLLRPPTIGRSRSKYDWQGVVDAAAETPLEPLRSEDMSDVVLVRFDDERRPVLIRMARARWRGTLEEALRRFAIVRDPSRSPIRAALGLVRAPDRRVICSAWNRA